MTETPRPLILCIATRDLPCAICRVTIHAGEKCYLADPDKSGARWQHVDHVSSPARPPAPPDPLRTLILRLVGRLEAIRAETHSHTDTRSERIWLLAHEAQKDVAAIEAVRAPQQEEPKIPQLQWQGPDEDGDYIVSLSGFPSIAFTAHGPTRELTLHYLGDQLVEYFKEGCEICAEKVSLEPPRAPLDEIGHVLDDIVYQARRADMEMVVTQVNWLRAEVERWRSQAGPV